MKSLSKPLLITIVTTVTVILGTYLYVFSWDQPPCPSVEPNLGRSHLYSISDEDYYIRWEHDTPKLDDDYNDLYRPVLALTSEIGIQDREHGLDEEVEGLKDNNENLQEDIGGE